MKKISILFQILIISMCLTMVISLSFAQKIETVDGVKIIHNEKPKWGKKPKVTLELIKKIGDLETDDENYQLYRPIDVVKDVEGNIYILERGNCCIKKYDKNGTYVTTIGRKGKGPGEFEGPMILAINQRSQIYILDLLNSRIQKYSTKGEELGSIKISLKKRPLTFGFLNSDKLLVHTMEMLIPGQKSDDKKEKPFLLYTMDSEGNYHNGIVAHQEYKNFQITNLANVIHFVIDKDDNIYVSFICQNRIEKYNANGTLLFRTDRPLKYKIDHKMVKRTFSGVEMPIPEMTMVSTGISVDQKGRIWVLTVTKQGKIDYTEPEKSVPPTFEIEIYDKDGILLGSLPSVEIKGQLRIFGDNLYLVNTEEEMCVYEYRIVEK